MRRTLLVLSLTVMSAVVLLCGPVAMAQAEDEPPAPTWQVRAITTPVQGVVPSFIGSDDGNIAWTGAAGAGNSRMFVFNLVSGANTAIPNVQPGAYYNPSVEGSWVVYQGHKSATYDDIYLYETQSKTVTQVTYNASPGDWNDWNPRIDGNRVVWEKDMLTSAAKPGIYLYDIDTGSTTLILAGAQYRNPDIWDDYLVCVQNVTVSGKNASEIVLYNMVTQAPPTVIGSSNGGLKSNEHPRIDSGRVVWSSGDMWTAGAPDTTSTFQIYLYDIASATTDPLTTNIAGNFAPSIEGDLVAWETARPAAAIMVHDIAAGTSQQISLLGDVGHAPEVDGNTVAWFGNQGLYSAVFSTATTTFPDVPADHPYATAIEGMAARNIISGYLSGYFGPNDLVTRQQFAKMIVLTMGLPVTEESFPNPAAPFVDLGTDSATDLYPHEYVAVAALNGITVGVDATHFAPTRNITRAQVITMTVRAGSQVLQPPPSGYKGVLGYGDPTHGQNIRLAEYNGLLVGIQGTGGGLTGWNTSANATRGEVAQILWNLLAKLPPAS